MGSTDASMPPVKTGEYQNRFLDSTRWNDFPWRSDDVVIGTYAKSGTTWTQQIARQLIHKGNIPNDSATDSPWVDLRVLPHNDIMACVEAQDHRRFLKTHLPLHAMVWKPEIKYIYIARDGRDMVWSFIHHLMSMTDQFYELANTLPGRVGPPYYRPKGDPYEQFQDLITNDEAPSLPWPFWNHVREWWAARDQPNLLLVHFNDLKADLDGQMRRIQAFLGTEPMSEEEWANAVEHCTFDWMKAHADELLGPGIHDIFNGGGQTFINKGTNGRWKDRLTEEDVRRYHEKAEKELGPECARWLEKGFLG